MPVPLSSCCAAPSTAAVKGRRGGLPTPILFTGKAEKLSLVSTGSGATGWLTYYVAR